MIYLAWQMFFWLLAALVLGVLVGRHLQDRRVKALKRDLHRLQGELENARIQLHRNLRHPAADIAERSAAPPAAAGQVDDLQRINGIGPKIAGLLHARGITRYAQIAQLTAAQLQDLGDSLGAFTDRIAREDWCGQARALHRDIYGEDL